jgi:hypothetical protein
MHLARILRHSDLGEVLSLPNMGSGQLDHFTQRAMANPEAKIVLAHAGPVKAAMIAGMLDAADAHCRQCNDPVTVRKRLIQVLLESVDNICRHATGALGESSAVLVARDGAGWLLFTGNVVPAATAVLLAHRIGILNSMGREDLRDHYLRLLSNTDRSRNGGAGLGLLTMARKTARPILVAAEPMGPFTSYFTFEMRVAMEPGQDDPAAA